jgi:hypothetical protein
MLELVYKNHIYCAGNKFNVSVDNLKLKTARCRSSRKLTKFRLCNLIKLMRDVIILTKTNGNNI